MYYVGVLGAQSENIVPWFGTAAPDAGRHKKGKRRDGKKEEREREVTSALAAAGALVSQRREETGGLGRGDLGKRVGVVLRAPAR